jgi:hypothetical protein
MSLGRYVSAVDSTIYVMTETDRSGICRIDSHTVRGDVISGPAHLATKLIKTDPARSLDADHSTHSPDLRVSVSSGWYSVVSQTGADRNFHQRLVPFIRWKHVLSTCRLHFLLLKVAHQSISSRNFAAESRALPPVRCPSVRG